MRVNILIPMAGSGKRFLKAGFKDHKPLIDVDGRPMVQRVIDNLTPHRRDYSFKFICMADHSSERLLDILRASRFGEIVLLSSYTEGATSSALKAAEFIDDDNPLIVASCDQLVDWNVDDFLDCVYGLDGALVTYKTNQPNHSYCQSASGKIVRVAEKEVISDQGNVGIYYFGKGRDFVAAAKKMIADNVRFNGEFYNSLVYNTMIEMGLKNLEIYEIKPEEAHVIGTPESLAEYVK